MRSTQIVAYVGSGLRSEEKLVNLVLIKLEAKELITIALILYLHAYGVHQHSTFNRSQTTTVL